MFRCFHHRSAVSLAALGFSLCAVLIAGHAWSRHVNAKLAALPPVPAPAFVGVDVTATGGTLSASYATLQAAFAAINAGTHTGVITLDLTADTTETGTAVLNASGSGSASYTSIAIKPAGGAARTISGSLNSPLIDLNGADNVTIDGLNTGGDALTLSNTSNTATASTIRFINGATSNIVQNATLESASTNASGGTVFFSTDATTVNGNDNNQIANCNLGPAGGNTPTIAVYSDGTNSRDNSGNMISNCNIFDFYSSAATDTAGVWLDSYNTDWTITGNSFYQTASRIGTSSTVRGIYVNNTSSGNNFTVTGNFIGGGTANAGGAAWTISSASLAYRFVGIELNTSTTTPSNVQGNTVKNLSWLSTSAAETLPGVWSGIYVKAGAVNVGTTTGNTIGSGTGAGAVSVTTSGSGGVTFGIGAGGNATRIISNNAIGSITTNGTAAGVSASLIGIQVTAGANTISGNTVGSTTTANSLNASNSSTSGTAQQVTGILSSSTGGATITNNTVANLNNNYTGTNTAGQIRGVVASSGSNTISGNTIRNLSTSSKNTGNASAAAVLGISDVTTVAGQTIAQNTVHSLTSTATAPNQVEIYGIHYSGTSSGTNLVARNFVHSLAHTAGTPWLRGISLSSGVTTCQNNMVRLGLDAAGNSIPTANSIVGIYDSSGTNSFYHNTVFIGGTDGNNTFAFNSDVNFQTRAIRNNLFVNARASGIFGAAARYNVTIPPSGMTLSNNLYFSGSIFPIINGATTLGTLQAWQRTENQDAGSALASLGQINFVNATGNASTVDLHVQSPTAAEGAGFNAGITDDFDSQTRATLTPVDIGADALNATGIDIFPPAISFTPLAFASSTTNRTLTTTITDLTGVPMTGALVPRIYYRKGAGTWFSQPGTLTAGTGTNGTWDFTINNADLGGVVCGNLISYYVIAQDTATIPNLNSQVLGVTAANVNTVTTHPTTPNSYRIRFFGAINVGAAQAYASLNSAGGLFEAINASGLSANTIINLTSDLLTENGGVALNQWAEEGAGNYTLLIQPSGGARLVTGNSNIEFNGADRVTIDGLNSGGNALLLRGVGTGPWLWFSNDASNNAVRNCTIEGSTTSNTAGVINFSTGATTGNDNNTIENNTIRDRTDFSFVPSNLIYSQGSSAALSNSNITISNNQLINFTSNGILFNNSNNDNATISGNTIYQTAARTGLIAAINFSAAGVNVITQNVVRDLNSSNTKQGIKILNVLGTTVSRNRIYNFSGLGAMYGIEFVPALGATSHVTLVNNQITLTAINTNQSIIGIRDNSTNASAGSLTAYYNTALIGGTATGTATQAFRIEASAKSTTLRNNLLINHRTGGSVAHYALDRASNAGSFTSNYNFLSGTGSPTSAEFIGRFGTAVDYATWQAGAGAPDLNSFASVASGVNTNVFTDPANGNLDININGDVPTLDFIARHATPLAVTTDFNNLTRHAMTPDIGADEFNVLPVVTPLAGPVRVQGNPVSNSSIATATDLEDLETALALAVSSDGMTFGNTAALNGVTINNLAINASGNVTADVIAGCNATAASFTLRVTDLESGQTVATISVSVNLNTLPVLSYNPTYNIAAGCPLIIQPLTGPSDNYQITSVTVHNVTPALTFAPTVSATGVVTIPAANPGGDHVITIRATDNCGLTTDATFTLNVITLTLQPAANLNGTTAAPGSLVTTQGRFFTATQATANALPLPTSMAGVTVNVTDSANVTRPAELFYVTPTLLSFVVPSATAIGPASVAITTASSGTFTESLPIAVVAPGLFTLTGGAANLANGYVIRDNGVTQTIEPIARFNPTTRQWETVPINVSTDTVYLVLNGSGFRNGSTFTATVASTSVTVNFAGAAPNPPGYDHLKVLLPASLAGVGIVNVNATVNSQPANGVMVQIQ